MEEEEVEEEAMVQPMEEEEEGGEGEVEPPMEEEPLSIDGDQVRDMII